MRSFLITGGTGSFGRAFIDRLLKDDLADRVIVFSRDELKQHEMRVDGLTDERVRYFIGDVRDQDRLRRAMNGVDVVIHAAALKQVDTCEYNPHEAVTTNVIGAKNVIEAALDSNVKKVVALGTDKAVDPTNLYGATKLVAEKLVVDANAYSQPGGPVFAGTRYGNVISSRGSVIPVFEKQHQAGETLTLTAEGMTRFVMTLPQCVQFVLDSIREMRGGEVFVPKLPAVTLETIAAAVAYPSKPVLAYTGLRPGEKIHEALLSPHEAPRTRDRGWCFAVSPIGGFRPFHCVGDPVKDGFSFSSDQTRLLSVDEFRLFAGMRRRAA